jgi:hypothetical protein
MAGAFVLMASVLGLSAAEPFDVIDGIVPHAREWRSKYVTVQRVPPFVATATLLTVEQVKLRFAAAGANWPETRHRQTEFLVADHGWLQCFLDWQHAFQQQQNLRYRRESFDCDDYGMSMMALVDLALLRAGTLSRTALVGRLAVEQRERWAGTRAGGMHEVILVATERGLLVVEPQNGRTIELKDYPNRSHFRRLILN